MSRVEQHFSLVLISRNTNGWGLWIVRRGMTDTRLKLEEAEYFFEGMKRNMENDKPFIFNLSAFVTSARSVSFFMQKQYGGHKFSEWYKKKQKLFDSDNDFKFFNELRVATVHTKALLPNKRVSVSIMEPFAG